ncbi:hypothetical protein P4B35_13980 [Pontiellaceae bacterium B12227]|nr:hypothetical protein [Pontiellaceae bacterium B12227]
MKIIFKALCLISVTFFSVMSSLASDEAQPSICMDETLVIIAGEKSIGHGFVLHAGDKYYIITTQRVIFGNYKLQFKTVSGNVLRPMKVELAEDRDVARLLLRSTEGLNMSSRCGMHDRIVIPRSSDNELSGEIIGMGADRIEVSAEFSNSQSGSPVLNQKGNVIGVASYVVTLEENAVDSGTKWQALPRRIAYRLDGINWISVNWRSYNREYGNMLSDMDQFRRELYKIMISWCDSPRFIRSKGINDLNLKKWVARYNAKMRYTIMSNNDRDNIDDFARELSGICSDKVRIAKLIASQKNSSTYISNHFEAIANELNQCANYVLRIGSLVASQN